MRRWRAGIQMAVVAAVVVLGYFILTWVSSYTLPS